MSRKKSRKPGPIGTPKANSPAPLKSKKPKKRSGKPAGNRQNIESSNVATRAQQVPSDPRIGSKKPIQLVVEQPKSNTSEAKRYFSPQQELKALEQDTRLNKLLDAFDQGISLSDEEQRYLDSKLARHQQLCKLLGLTQQQTEQPKSQSNVQPSDDDQLWQQFESIDPGKFSE